MARQLPALASAVPRKASRAPCQEVVLRRRRTSISTALPVMTTWPKDGGPFFTLPNVITRDPDTGARNIGMYRMQRIDRRDDRDALADPQDRRAALPPREGARASGSRSRSRSAAIPR